MSVHLRLKSFIIPISVNVAQNTWTGPFLSGRGNVGCCQYWSLVKLNLNLQIQLDALKKEHLCSLPVPHPDHTDVLPLLSSFIQSPSFHAGARPLSDDLFSSLCILATIQLHNELFGLNTLVKSCIFLYSMSQFVCWL